MTDVRFVALILLVYSITIVLVSLVPHITDGWCLLIASVIFVPLALVLLNWYLS